MFSTLAVCFWSQTALDVLAEHSYRFMQYGKEEQLSCINKFNKTKLDHTGEYGSKEIYDYTENCVAEYDCGSSCGGRDGYYKTI